jgi:2,4-diaminopentanoate dehydrogenase
MRPYRVVQWATGNIGARALRGVIQHPHLELVGVFVHSPDKAGLDAAGLCGLDAPTGVVATHRMEDVLALHADCVLYMPRACDVDEVARLLESGANVVTTRGEFHHPASMDPAMRDRVQATCALGSSSIHSTGSSPGFITEALPIVVTSIQRRLDRLRISEFADLSQRDSPGLLFDVMGFGRAPWQYDEGRLSHGRSSFGPSLSLLADALSIPLDGIEARGEIATVPRRTEIAAGTLEQGTVAAQRMVVSAMREGQPVLQFCATWYCSTKLDQDWDLRATGWSVQVDGDAPLDIDLRFPITLDQMAEVSPGYTANRAVNAVRFVVEAPPGIRTTLDLPQIVATLG